MPEMVPVLIQVRNAFGSPLACKNSLRYAGWPPIQMTALESTPMPCEPPITCPSSLVAAASTRIGGPGETSRLGAGRQVVPPAFQIHALWSPTRPTDGTQTRPTTIEPSLFAASADPAGPSGPVISSCRPPAHRAPWLKPSAVV